MPHTDIGLWSEVYQTTPSNARGFWRCPAPKQRNTQDEKDTIKAGKAAQEVWPDEPAKARMAANGKPQIDIAINALALSVRVWSPTVRAMTDHNFAKWSQQTTHHPMCGPTPLTGPRPMKPGLQPMAESAGSTVRSQRASHDQKRFVQPTEPS